MTVQERARIISRKVRALLNSGKFILGPGYTSRGLGKCQGCALSAVACAIGGLPEPGNYPLREEEAKKIGSKMTLSDKAQIEAGYEDFDWVAFDLRDKTGRKVGHKVIKAKPDNPFYKLGNRLARENGYCRPYAHQVASQKTLTMDEFDLQDI